MVSSVTASSGLALTLSVVSGPASIVNDQLFLTGLGPVTLRAEQAGNELYLPASAEWTVNVILPQLHGRLTDGLVELFWAAGVPGLKLQGRESLAPDSSWEDVTTSAVEADGEVRVRLNTGSVHCYFRLLRP